MPVTIPVFPLDITGDALSNKVENEVRVFANAGDRIFIPQGGPFFTASLVIRNNLTNALLVPNLDYKALHLVPAAARDSSQEVCAVIYITNPAVNQIRISSYQVIGGIHSNLVPLVYQLLQDLPPETLEENIGWGQILGKPVQFPPTAHTQHINTIYGMNKLITAVDYMRQAIQVQGATAYGAMYKYIDTSIGERTQQFLSNYFIANPIDTTATVAAPLAGDGTDQNPLRLNLQTAGLASGAGTSASPLRVDVQTAGLVTGTGSAGTPLRVDLQTAGLASGAGTLASPLRVDLQTTAPIIGTGSAGSPLQLDLKTTGPVIGVGTAASPVRIDIQDLYDELSPLLDQNYTPSTQVSTVSVNAPLAGNGASGNPLSLNLQTGGLVNGNGTAAEPLRVNLQTGGLIAGNGSSLSPLRVDLQTDGLIEGTGAVGSPLKVDVNTGGLVKGSGTFADPIRVDVATSGLIEGNGSLQNPLSMYVRIDETLAGAGTLANPLRVDLQTAGLISGLGTVANPLRADIQTAGIVGGAGVAGNPLVAVINTTAPLRGTGTSQNPLNINIAQLYDELVPSLNMDYAPIGSTGGPGVGTDGVFDFAGRNDLVLDPYTPYIDATNAIYRYNYFNTLLGKKVRTITGTAYAYVTANFTNASPPGDIYPLVEVLVTYQDVDGGGYQKLTVGGYVQAVASNFVPFPGLPNAYVVSVPFSFTIPAGYENKNIGIAMNTYTGNWTNGGSFDITTVRDSRLSGIYYTTDAVNNGGGSGGGGSTGTSNIVPFYASGYHDTPGGFPDSTSVTVPGTAKAITCTITTLLQNSVSGQDYTFGITVTGIRQDGLGIWSMYSKITTGQNGPFNDTDTFSIVVPTTPALNSISINASATVESGSSVNVAIVGTYFTA